MCLIDLNMLDELVSDLNKEIIYQISNQYQPEKDFRPLNITSTGDVHYIYFLGYLIYDCSLEKTMENILPEVNMELNERERFEKYLRHLIQDQVEWIKEISLV